MLEKVREESLKLRKNIDEVYEAGQQEAYRRIWGDIQDGGTRTNYQNAFYGMGKNAFKPVYDITVKQCSSMFQNSSIEDSLTDILNECGVKLIWQSDATGNTVFYGSAFTRLPHIVAPGTLSYFFCGCSKLETIDSIDVSRIPASSTSAFGNAFTGCTSLKNLTIIGEIAASGLNVYGRPLTHDSLMSIINALQKKTSGTFTITLGADNIAKLTQEEQDLVAEKGWNLA